jgi:hypothetical protein
MMAPQGAQTIQTYYIDPYQSFHYMFALLVIVPGGNMAKPVRATVPKVAKRSGIPSSLKTYHMKAHERGFLQVCVM